MKPEQQTAVAEAQAIVYGNREEIYGPPGETLERTAQIWSVIFGVPVTAEQVCWAMVGLKMAREVNATKRDNLVDALGYLMLIDRIREVTV